MIFQKKKKKKKTKTKMKNLDLHMRISRILKLIYNEKMALLLSNLVSYKTENMILRKLHTFLFFFFGYEGLQLQS